MFNKKFFIRFSWHLPILLVVATIMALSMQMFILPNKFAPAGVSGLSAIIQTLSGFPAGYSMFILNFPLVILAFFFIRKTFAAETMVYILLSSGLTELFRQLNVYQYRDEILLAALAGGVLNGACIGVLMKLGLSSGGTDIIGLLIQKKFTEVSISWIILALNIIILLFGGISYKLVLNMDLTMVISIVLFSFIMQFINSKTMDIILNGMSSAVKFEVITTKPKELSQKIIAVLHRGVTIIDSRGAYTDTVNNMLICVVRKRQIGAFRKILKQVDPQAFAYAMPTREVMGLGFN